jgi:transposase InsO family protein
MHAELRHRGVRVSRKRVARLMRAAGLCGVVKRPRGKTTIRVPGVRPAPDLVRRDFRPVGPNQLWVADLSEVATWDGKLYLAVVVDCFSRRCVGWAMAEHMRSRARRRGARHGRLAAQARRRPGPPLRPGLPARTSDPGRRSCYERRPPLASPAGQGSGNRGPLAACAAPTPGIGQAPDTRTY